MSFDTGKEDESVVDSSVTEWKRDVENLDNQESPSYKMNGEAYHSGAEEHGPSCDHVGTSSANRNKLHDTRYFIIKSLNHQNIQLSIEKGIWATQVMNEPILKEAYHNSGKVILIFSVNMSGFFQGYAQMISSVGWRRDSVWSQGSGGSKPWGRSFKVKWLRLHDLAFQKTLHLKNPLNEYKPVKISRDCQELPQEIGEALCELLDAENDVVENLNRPFVECTSSLRNEEYDVHPVRVALASAPMMYPSLLYQHQSETSRYHLAQTRPAGMFHNMPISSSTSEVAQSKNFCVKDCDYPSQFDGWGLPSERSLHTSALTEDDILEMTYEEYLEVHSRGSGKSHKPVKEPLRRTQDVCISKDGGDDLYAHSRSYKRTRH